jgi:hypothetical protein
MFKIYTRTSAIFYVWSRKKKREFKNRDRERRECYGIWFVVRRVGFHLLLAERRRFGGALRGFFLARFASKFVNLAISHQEQILVYLLDINIYTRHLEMLPLILFVLWLCYEKAVFAEMISQRQIRQPYKVSS